MSIECVIFDCDGLMFDTEKVANENWREIAGQYGITLDDEFFYQIIGCGHKLFLKAMENHQDLEPHLPEISEGRLKKIFGMCENKGSLNKKGLTELLDYLEEAGIKKCVASSSHREYVDTLLGSIGKPYHFDSVVCGDEVTHGKPDPEIFLTAARKAGVAPENCVVLEDSKFGIIAAKRAGMKSVWIYDFVKPDEEMNEAIQESRNDLLEVIDYLKEQAR